MDMNLNNKPLIGPIGENDSVKKGKRIFKVKKKLSDKDNGFYYFDNTGVIDDSAKDLYLNDKIYPANPDIKNNTRNCYMIIGSSGSGKSTVCAQYILKYYDKFYFPKSDQIYVISPKTNDPAFNSYRINRPALNVRNFADPDTKLTYDDFVMDENGECQRSALVIFDDIENISNLKIRQGVCELMDSILTNARYRDIWCVVICHNPFLKSFKTALLECNWTCFFPQNINHRIFNKYMYDHCGYLKDNRKILSDIKARHLFINPQTNVALTPYSAHII